MLTMMINNEHFPYLEAKYRNADNRIMGKDFVWCNLVYRSNEETEQLRALGETVAYDPAAIIMDKLTKQGVINIRDWAEAKVLEANPHYEEFTSHGTRKAGYWKEVNIQTPKTLFWIQNNSPRSITVVTNKIDGIGGNSESGSTWNKVQIWLQSGINVQIIIPETGYKCLIPAVTNRNTMPIFRNRFMCELAWDYLKPLIPAVLDAIKNGTEYSEEISPSPEEKADYYQDFCARFNKDPKGFIKFLRDKCQRLWDYRQAISDTIWTNVNVMTAPYVNDLKAQNYYTLETRVGFAISKGTESLMAKYALDMNIPKDSMLDYATLATDPKAYEEMVRIIEVYAPAFGISVKTKDSQADTMTYLAKNWVRDDRGTVTDSLMMKWAYNAKQGLKKDQLDKLFEAYVQIDWYLSQADPSEFIVPGYSLCTCGKPVRETITHYYNASQDKLYDMNTPVAYKYQYNFEDGDSVYPVTVCPYCGRTTEALEWENVSYEVLAYRLDQDRE